MPKSDHWNLPWYGHWVVLAVFGSGFLFAARSGNVPLGGLLVLGGMSLVGTALAVKTWKFGYDAISMMFGSDGPTLPQTPIQPVVMAAPSIPVRTSSERLGSMITSWFFAPLSVSALTGAISLVRPDLLHLHQGLSVAALFVSIATVANWAITLVSTMAEDQKWDNWTRRLMFGAGGIGTGGIAYALWNGLFQPGRDLFTSAGQDTLFANFGSHPLAQSDGTPTLAGFMCFFGFWFALVNWLKQTDRLRPSRLSMGSSLWSVIVAGLTTLVFAFPLEIALLWAVVVSASVQLTSPGLVPTRKA